MKRSMVLVAVLVVLLGIYWLMQSNRPMTDPDRPFVQIDTAQVTSLRIESSTDTVELARRGDQWFLTKPLEFPTAARMTDQALGRLGEMRKLTLVTDRPDRFREFQVDDSTGVKVSVTDRKKTHTFYLGKTSPTAGTSYARLDGSKEVWEIAGNMTPAFKRPVRDWRDKTISEADREGFIKFTFVYPKETISATLVDSVWKVEAGAEKFDADKNQISRVTGLLSRMSGVDFADTLAADAFDAPECHLIAELALGETLDLRLIPKGEDGSQYFLRKAGAPTDYVIYKSTAEVLMRKAADLRPKPEKSAEAPPQKPRG
ncbi:DUF4340 domain-containing protein [bacterium]|nr:DUF4340 domain-containing protein [bacterium]MBU1985549.1 DUF4340 domain-containing protein [bacterium]